MLLRRSERESFSGGFMTLRAFLAWFCFKALNSGARGFLPRFFFFGGSGLASTIWAFFCGTGCSSRTRGPGFAFLSLSSWSSSSSSDEEDEEDEEDDNDDDESEEDEDDEELLDFETGWTGSCWSDKGWKENHLVVDKNNVSSPAMHALPCSPGTLNGELQCCIHI